MTSTIAETTIEATSRAIVPLLGLMIGATVLMALYPDALLWLPRLLDAEHSEEEHFRRRVAKLGELERRFASGG